MGLAAYATSLLLLLLCNQHWHVQAQDDQIQAKCKRTGWVFLPKVQQKSWRAILRCKPSTTPMASCQTDPNCIGFTSDSEDSGWPLTLPALKTCPQGGSFTNRAGLDWEWEWSWVPLTCASRGVCCGTYIANDAGVNAAWALSCDSSDGVSSSFDPFKCDNRCPELFRTHELSPTSWKVQCDQQRAAAGLANRRRELLNSGSGSTSFPRRVRKRPSGVQASDQRGYVSEAYSAACSSIATFCS